MTLACAFGAAALVLVTGAAAAEPLDEPPVPSPAPARELQAGESRLRFYGMFRFDAIFDDSRPDAFQTPLFILSEADAAEDQANLTMHPRLTRLGLDASGPPLEPLGGGVVSGKLELDFQNGGRESRALPRFRHAYLQVGWRSTTLLVGQTWDLISPLFPTVNADTLMWNAGNLGDRRAQVRVSIEPPSEGLRWSLGVAAGLPGAVDAQDLDGDMIRDGEAAARPNFQARIGLSRPLSGKQLGLGAWGYLAQAEVATAIAGQTEFSSHAVGIDWQLPLGRRVVLRGEAWTGRGLSDVRGGIAQSVSRATGQEIDGRGGWAEVGIDVTGHYSLSAGYTLDAPDDDDVPAGGRRRNEAWFLVNRWSARPFGLGMDYLLWTTRYQDAPRGRDHRLNLYVTYGF